MRVLVWMMVMLLLGVVVGIVGMPISMPISISRLPTYCSILHLVLSSKSSCLSASRPWLLLLSPANQLSCPWLSLMFVLHASYRLPFP